MKVEYPLWLQQQEKIQENVKGETNDKIIQNFDQQSERLFDKISIGFGKGEASLIYSALKRLAVQKKAERVRFWGKILTYSKDYLIAEGYTK